MSAVVLAPASEGFVPLRLTGLVLIGSAVVALVATMVPAWLAARAGVASGLRADD